MLEKIKDKHLEVALRCAKKRGLRPFFSDPKKMIALRAEAARRGIYASSAEEAVVFRSVTERMEDRADGRRAW